MQFFRVREKAMTLAEVLTGSRKTYAINLIGGVRRDILAEQRLTTLKLVGDKVGLSIPPDAVRLLPREH